MEVMKMAAGDDYKDDDEDDHDGHGDGEFTPTNRSEHSYELYVEGAGRGHADPASGLPPHRRMSVFTEEDEDEALAAAAAAAAGAPAEQQEGRDRRVSEWVPQKRGETEGMGCADYHVALVQSTRLLPLPSYHPQRSSFALLGNGIPLREGVRVCSCAYACRRGCVDGPNYVFMPLRNFPVTRMVLSPIARPARARPVPNPDLFSPSLSGKIKGVGVGRARVALAGLLMYGPWALFVEDIVRSSPTSCLLCPGRDDDGDGGGGRCDACEWNAFDAMVVLPAVSSSLSWPRRADLRIDVIFSPSLRRGGLPGPFS